jgi:DNA-directed RNA polymerase subunit RPC12/RpoP
MRVIGAGGCFDNRIYEQPVEVLWKIALQVLFEQDVKIVNRNDQDHLIEGRVGEKIFSLCIKKLDDTTSQVIIDSHKKIIQVYSWKKESEPVDDFYELFEKKVSEFEQYVVCPNCNSQIVFSAKFCPNCGHKMH